MNVVDRLLRDIDVIKTGVAVNFVSNCVFYLFFGVVLSNVFLLLNYLLVGLDLCGLFLSAYEALGFPLVQRGFGQKSAHPFFCHFEVAARPIFFVYAASFCLLAVSLYLSNILGPWRKSLQILIFFSILGLAVVVVAYSDSLFIGFYRGSFIRAVIEFVSVGILIPLPFMAFCFGLRTGNQFTVKG